MMKKTSKETRLSKENWTTSQGANARARRVLLAGLEAGTTYEWRPVSGDAPGPVRSVTRVEGLAFGRGTYAWPASPLTPMNTALIRVISNDGAMPQDDSDNPFLIANNRQYKILKDCSEVLQLPTALDGDMPVNMSGGVLSSNPIGASGMLRFAEAALQVRGQAGEHQVDGAHRALGHAYGGGSQYFSMWIVADHNR